MAQVTVATTTTTLDAAASTRNVIVDNRGPGVVTLASGRKVLPFQSAQVAVTAGTPLTATATVSSTVNVDAQPGVDSDGGGIADGTVRFVDLNADVVTGLGGTFGRLGTPTKVGAIGDSITASLGANAYVVGGRSWQLSDAPIAYALAASDGRWDLVVNAGIAGQRSDQILARVQPEIIAAGCQVCVIVSTYWNDYSASYTVAQTVANIKSMVALCNAAGVTPVVCLPTPPARGSTGPALTAALAWSYQVAYALRAWCTVNRVVTVDVAAALVDTTTGQLSATYNLDSSVHPNPAGFQQMGLAIQKTLDAMIPPASSGLIQTVADPSDILLGQGMFPTNTGGVPTGWYWTSGTSGYTPSVGTDSAVLGNMFTITGNPGVGIAYLDSPGINGWSVGDLLEIKGILTTTGAVATTQPTIRIVTTGGANYGLYQPKALMTRGRFRLVWPVATGTTTVQIRFQLGAGTSSLSVGQVSVRNLTASSTVQP